MKAPAATARNRLVLPFMMSGSQYCRSAARERGSETTDVPVHCNGGSASTFGNPFDRVPQPFDSLIVEIKIEILRRATRDVFDISPYVFLCR